MSIIVKKFGGTSVESIEKVCKIAEYIASVKKQDHIVIVVSAMGKTTNELLNLAHEITKFPNQRELDMLITAGERITMALLSLALQRYGVSSISFTGSQSGIITDNAHGNAKILCINAYRIKDELKKKKVVIVAGFQGVSLEKEITTLGRGGSDTTAVALACFLKAKKCEIFTDVEGVLTADPRIVTKFQKINKLSHEEMLFMALSGAKVLHSRAAEFAYKYQIPVEIKSGTTFIEGTMIDKMENTSLRTLTTSENIIIIEMIGKKDEYPVIHTPIVDLSSTGKTFVFMVEQKYRSSLIKELKESNVRFKEQRKTYCLINILGYRICNDLPFFYDLSKTLTNNCGGSYLILNKGIGIQIRIDQIDAQKTINILNEKYIINGVI